MMYEGNYSEKSREALTVALPILGGILLGVAVALGVIWASQRDEDRYTQWRRRISRAAPRVGRRLKHLVG